MTAQVIPMPDWLTVPATPTVPQPDFIEFLESLAPEGEKVLFGKAVTMQDGVDGYVPTDTLPPNVALYANTGSFIKTRADQDGKLRAKAENIEQCLFLMLDDIGTKAKTPPVEPTWKIETSPGNFQWGYAYAERPTKGEQSAAVRAFAAAGYSDPGASNAVRWSRIPGSLNKKKQFVAKLTEFHPERKFTLAQVCAEMGVTMGEPDKYEAKAPTQTLPIPADIDEVLACIDPRGNYTETWSPTVLGTLNTFGAAAVPHLVKWSLPWYAANNWTEADAIADIAGRIQEVGLATWENVRDRAGLPREELKFGAVPDGEQFSEIIEDEALFETNLPHPQLDLKVVPPILVATAKAVAANVGCDMMLPIAAGLIAACTVIDSRSSLLVKEGMTVPPILRMMPVATPADSKTPGSKPMFKIIDTLQIEQRAKHEADMLQWVGQEARHAADMKAFKDWQHTPEAQFPGALPPGVMGLPPKPAPLRLKTNGATTAKVLGLLSTRPYGMTYILDDGSEWLESLANPNRYDSKTVYLRTYEGGPDNIDRMGGFEEIFLPNAALSMYLNAHPKVLYKLREKLSNDGALQRMVPIPLDTTKTTAGGTVPGYDKIMEKWGDTLRQIFATGEKAYELSPEASALWQSFKEETTELKKAMQASRYSDYAVGYAGKLDGLAARVALVLHMMTDINEKTVGIGTMENAITFARYALRCAAFIDNAHMESDTTEAWIIRHILVISDDKATVTRSEIYRSGHRVFSEMPKRAADDVIMETMEMLERQNWCTPFYTPTKSVVWLINPALKTMYAERRKKIVKMRADVVAKITGHRRDD